ncbi:hypothetical protein BS47DRAFT_1367685 [Hydnum rufescens UP504]|uniref:Uncharacterized protein n=1 Tax=Hydnum rufescens UP504 TaxID=1448309 RepID=A0A9P6AI31_9AGAM|nr:hypothetical protein BS47DRAFT_1367685 [Hydnum rufescens UP504]
MTEVADSETDSSLHYDSVSTSTRASSLSQYSVSEMEFYYSGLPSSPKLVYRTGTPWTKPTGLEAYRELKEHRAVFGRKLDSVWKQLGPETSFALGRERPVGPVVLWVGVTPKSLSSEDAHTAAQSCLDLLKKFEITDVEVEFRESIYTQSAGPSLLKPVSNLDLTVDVCDPLTPALGLSITTQATPHAEGTGGFYLTEGGNSKKVLLVARHVLFPLKSDLNYTHTNISAPRRNVLLLGTQAFNNLVKTVEIKIESRGIAAEIYGREIEGLQEREAGEDNYDVKKATRGGRPLKGCWMMRTRQSKPLMSSVDEATSSLPPLTFDAGMEGFTEDYAVVELDSSKIAKTFMGNVIDLGTKIPGDDFTRKMYPRRDAATTFKYPRGRLLKLQGLITEHQMRTRDCSGESCLFVIKNGKTTGVTIGRASGIFSFIRQRFDDGTHRTSMEWAIIPYDKQ